MNLARDAYASPIDLLTGILDDTVYRLDSPAFQVSIDRPPIVL
jgi:hypothetical protein